MLYIKEGYPQPNEIVLCTVKKIYGNTVFVNLNEYEKEAVLTISEIAPGRIRNLRDYVVENKTIVCKVLRTNGRNNQIDISLRRVPVYVMREKLEEIKKEEYADRIYIDIAKELKTTKDELFEKTYTTIFETYETVFEALYEIMLDNQKINMFSDLKKEEKDIFLKIINDRIKPEEVVFKKQFTLSSLSVNGIEQVKSAIKTALESINYNKLNIIYLAASKFEISIKHDDIKSADKIFTQFRQNLEKSTKALKLELEIQN